MADKSGSALGAGKLWIGIGAAVVVAVLGYCAVGSRDPVPEVAAETTPETTPETTAVTPPEAVAQDAPTTDAIPTPDAPGFDVVRVDPEGRAVVAGHAAPGATVQLSMNGEPIETLNADDAGNFVALLDLSITEPGQLSLQAMNEDGEVVQGAPPAQTVLIEPRAPQPVSEQDAPEMADENTTPQSEAPRVLLADNDGITVLQDEVSDLTVQNVIIDAITYDDQGEVALSGRASGGGALRVYLDNDPVKTAPIPENGQWRLPLPDVAAGVYTLRVDELAADGTVTSRTETPFKREDVAQIAATAPTSETPAKVEAVTVQPGSPLWAIARDTWGEGPLYVRLFDANRDQIKNPDLIYPGQVFAIPD
jgi:nucleoid-associated protein YgaU